MRIKRLKQYRKYANLFKMNHGFNPPFKYIVDGSFLHMAMKTNTPLKDTFRRVFQDDMTLITTTCITAELQSMGEKVSRALNLSKSFIVEPCNHEGIVSADECIKAKLGDRNRFKFILCTLDYDLATEVASKMVVPVFYFKNMVLMMAQPSEFLKNKIAIKEHMNQDLNEDERKFIKENKQEILKLKSKERKEEKRKIFEEEKSLHVMYKKKQEKKEPKEKKRRKRAGKRKKRDVKSEEKAQEDVE
ncbi:unnamed protein product [Moneuplotes crassus]|uniref:Uncharacterized protein n=1 Tax=Euplotes crassus TaxID=5936 RepID=A0AAD1XUE5_EUPCR|nr:unnamed protein product [Moneuplotes crassus]